MRDSAFCKLVLLALLVAALSCCGGCATMFGPAQLTISAPQVITVQGVKYVCIQRSSEGPFGASLTVLDIFGPDGKLIASVSNSNAGMAQNLPGMVGQIVTGGINAFTPAAIAFGLNK